MKNINISMIALSLFANIIQINAQIASTSDNLIARPASDRKVPFNITDTGVSKTIKFGADLAWASEQNFRRNILFMGLDQVDIVRASFQPTYPLVNNTDLTQQQLVDLNWRLNLINTYVGPNTDLTLNCDHPSVDSWYAGQPARWLQLIKASAQKYRDAGHNIITIGAFNEPDYGWGQGSDTDMYNITSLMKNDSFFNGVRFGGGNTLNCDAAQWWYDRLRPAGVTEGNTHQLAGGFDGYASFFQNVRANGHYATADELHNIVEALVGYEYGMQTGIWWADIDLASGEMVKAFDGQRIGYAEHRPNWTAAAVYRTPEGKIKAFGGTSERQAVTTSYNYISKDRVVYYDGQGPQREFVLVMPGGTGYGQGQTNAERVVNITYGEDIQPVINGRYVLVNRSSGLVMQVTGSTTQDGSNVLQGGYSNALSQQWDVTPVDSRIGGDFSYFRIKPVSDNTKSLDLVNYSLDNGANIHQWTVGNGGNQQWYLDYAADGWFYIRSRESSKCLIADGTNNVVQWEKNGNNNQQWRLLPVGKPIEFVAPSAPSSLVATAQAASIRLNWTASTESDVAGYTIFRAESAGGAYNTIARNVTSTSFVDNTTLKGVQYFYKIKAVDGSLNRSVYSNQVSATSTGAHALVTHLKFDGNTSDASINLNHSATYGGTSFATGKVGSSSIKLNGADAFIQLPADIANHQEITVSTWVYWNGGSTWQRIFDFGNSESQYMFLSPNSGSGTLRFAINNGSGEQTMDAPVLPTNGWSHVAVTLGTTGARMYVNGNQVAQSTTLSIRPLDFKPVLNYIGRSQYPDPLLNGSVDDFRVYNYALSAIEIANLGSTVAYYQLRNRTSALYLDGMGLTTNGANCGQYANTTNINSEWDLIDAGDGYYQLQNHGTGMFLDGMGRTVNGEAGGQYLNATHPNSHWSIEPFDVNFYRIRNRITGLYLDGMGRTTNGSDVGQWANTTSTNAQWQFVSTSSALALKEGLGKKDILKEEGVVEDSKSILVYPNPTSNVLNVRLQNEVQSASASIFNLSGQLVKSTNLKTQDNAVDVSVLPAGVYIVEVITPSETKQLRFIKK